MPHPAPQRCPGAIPLVSTTPFKLSVLSSALLGSVLLAQPFTTRAAEPVSNQNHQLSPITVQTERERTEGYQAVEGSSPKYTAPLLDTPRSVTVIPQELMQDRGASSLTDVLRTTPGITLGSGEGGTPEGDRPFIRGYESSTDILIDGLRDYARGSHEVFNLESVEILKGPSSAYSGRGSTGGSINLVSKTPKLGDFAEGSLGLGTDGNWRATADGNWAFSDSAAFRLNLMKMGGEVPGRDHVDIDRLGIAPSLAFGLGTPTRVTLSYARVEVNDMPDWGVPYKNAARPDRITPPDVDRSNFYGRAKVDFRTNTSDTATIKAEHDLNDKFTVRNTTRYIKTLNHYLFTRPSFDNCSGAGVPANCATEAPGIQFTRADRARYRTSQALINQSDLSGEFNTGSIRHRIAAGLEVSREEIWSKTITGLPGADRDDLYNPDPFRDYNYNLSYGPKTSDGYINTTALYLFDTVKFNDQWEANAGLRYDNYRVNNHTDSRTDNIWNYQLGLVYKPVSYGSVYVSHGTSSNPVGENLGQAGGADGPAGGASIRDLKPEKSLSWELGTKWDLMNRKLSLTGALFETRKTDARTYDLTSGDVTLGGNNRVRGLELGVAGSITPAWGVWGGFTYLDPKLTSYVANATTDYSGNQMKFIAKQSLSLWSTYKVLPQLVLGGGATYVGKRFVDDANTLELDATWRFDAMARYDINRKLSVQLNLNNLTNETVYDASHVGIFAKVAPGRSAMLTVKYRYE